MANARTFPGDIDFRGGGMMKRARFDNLESFPASPNSGEMLYKPSEEELYYRGSDQWYPLASKQYVDIIATGLRPKDPVAVLAVANVNVAAAPATIDGYTLLSGDRVMLNGQADPAQNGVYVFSAVGSPLTRAADADSDDELVAGSFFFVENGDQYNNAGMAFVTDSPYVLDTDPLAFRQVSGAGQIQGGNGLVASGNIINVGGTADRVEVFADSVDIASTYAGQPSITVLGTIATGTWQGSAVGVAYGGTGNTTFNANELLTFDGTKLTSSGKFASSTPQKFAATIGDGSSTTYSVAHGLATEDVQVQLFETGGAREIVDANIAITDSNTVSIKSFGVAPDVGSLRVIVIG